MTTLRSLTLAALLLLTGWVGVTSSPAHRPARALTLPTGPTPGPDALPPPLAAESAWPSAPSGDPTFEDQVMELVNQARWENGQLPPYKRVDLLDSSSETHSDNMAQRDFFAHCDPDTGTLPWDRMQAAGYNWNSAAENIAAGYSSPAAVMSGWMNSSGHRANILSGSYREIGIGYVYQSGDQGNVRTDSNSDCNPDDFDNGPYFNYWTQNFGRRNGIYPLVIEREAFETAGRQVALYVYGPSGADEMRFCNENGTWSAWQTYSPNADWTLSVGNGLKTVRSEVRDGGTVYEAQDVIQLNEAGGATVTASPSATLTPTLTPSPTGPPGPTPEATPTQTATTPAGPGANPVFLPFIAHTGFVGESCAN